MISHNYKFIYIFVPKSASCSIRDALSPVTNTKLSVRIPYRSLIKYRKSYGVSKLGAYYKFSFVRNPWDRMVSRYFYEVRNEKGMENWGYPSTIPDHSKCLKKYIKDNEHYKKNNQLYWLVNRQGEMVLDFVGRLENIEVDFDSVCKHLNLPDEIKMVHINKTKHRDYKEYYDEESKSMVSELCRQDIEYFDYSF